MPAKLEPGQLDEAVKRVVDALHPVRVYLFGSHAYGNPHAHSDVDLFAVVHESGVPSYKRAMEAYKALSGLCLPVEVHVRTEAEFEHRSQAKTSLERAIKEKGKPVYVA